MVGESNHIKEKGKAAIKLIMWVKQQEVVTVSIAETIWSVGDDW